MRTQGLLSGYSSGPAQTAKQSEEGHKIAASLSQQLVEQLAQRGVRARRATWSEYPPLDAILIEGQFVSIDKGSTVMRTVVGFGAGASKIQTVV